MRNLGHLFAILTISSSLCYALDGSYGNFHVDRVDDDGGLPSETNDVRLGYWLMPLDMSIATKSNGTDGYKKTGEFDSGRRLSLLWVPPLTQRSSDGSGLLAAELSSTVYRQRQTTADPEVTWRSYAVTVHANLAWTLGSDLDLECGPFVGYGYSSVSSASGNGDFWEFGVRLGCYWTVIRHLQVGLDTRYQGTYGRQRFEYGTSNLQAVIKTHGLAGGAQIGCRF